MRPLLLWTACLSLLVEPAGAAGPGTDVSGLDALLARLSRTATLFHEGALEFTCDEFITWSGAGIEDGRARFEYIFSYDDEGELEDFRTTVARGRRRKVPKEVTPTDHGVPAYVRSAYLWVLTFHESRHALHDYRILGEDEIDGVPVVRVAFEPRPPYRDRMNDWFGVAWVDPEKGQILRVVARRPEDHATHAKLQAFLDGEPPDRDWYEVKTVTTEFTREKNGLRLPGTVTIDKSDYWGKSRARAEATRRTRLLVTQTFRKYRFFSVRSAGEIRGFIEGTRSLDR